MKLPDETPVTEDAFRAIAARHGLGTSTAERLPSPGIINTVYAMGDVVLRVPRNHEAHIAQARAEAIAIPEARRVGVRTPELVAYDDSLEVLPVPYLLVERVNGVNAETAGTADDDVWREMGRDIARLHTFADPNLVWSRKPSDVPEIGSALEDRIRDGTFSSLEGSWFSEWLDKLGEPAPVEECFVHGDVQMANVLVRDSTYVALIDFGCAALNEPVSDFQLPMVHLTKFLDGYAKVTNLPDDVHARVVRRALHMIFWLLPRSPTPILAWGERPLAWLIDLLRFFVDPPDAWRYAGPPA